MKKTQNQEISNTFVSNQDKEMTDAASFNPVKGEMALWSAVITQALMDAGSKSKKAEVRKEKAKAIRWLLGNSMDFHIVCLNAGLNPVYVRQKALEAIGRNCIWRRSTEIRNEKSPHLQSSSLSVKQYYIPKRPPYQPMPQSQRSFHNIAPLSHPAGFIPNMSAAI